MYRKTYNEFNKEGFLTIMVDIDGIVSEDFSGEQIDAFDSGVENTEYLNKCDDSYMRTIFFQQ